MKNEQEKKQYTAPAMETVACEFLAYLLESSEIPDSMDVDWDD